MNEEVKTTKETTQKEWTNCAYCAKRLKDLSYGYCSAYCEQNYAAELGQKGTTCVGVNPNPEGWINGVWEHITKEPILITGGRKQLLDVCQKYNVYPKALLKRKSQEKGWEVRKRSY